MIDPTLAALVVTAFFLGGLVKGAIGLGAPVVVLSFLAYVMPLREAIAVFLIPGMASNIWQATNGPHLPALLKRMWSFLLAALVGIFIGVTIMAGTKSEIMVVVLGVLLIAYSLHALFGTRLPAPGRHEVWLSPACGGIGGVFLGLSGLFLIPGVIYLETLRMPRDQFVQGLGLTFVTIILGLGFSMTTHHLITWPLAILSMVGIFPIFAGLWAGRRLRHKISEEGFRKLFFIALIISGAYMIARNWSEITGGVV